MNIFVENCTPFLLYLKENFQWVTSLLEYNVYCNLKNVSTVE
jgi:hypothetical protein